MTTLTQDWQVAVGDLVLGPGTPYTLAEFNPFNRTIRASQTAQRPWRHGSWSGRELIDETVVPLRVVIQAGTTAAWLAATQALTAAFAPTADGSDTELRFRLAGSEYVMFGRPRMVEPTTELAVLGNGFARAAFVALDPLIYSAAEHSQLLGLPSSSGGLTVPITVPITITSTVTSGRATIINAGTADTSLTLTIAAGAAPLVEPRVTLLAGSTVSVLRVHTTLEAGQVLTLDTAARTAYLAGGVSRRGKVSGDWPLLPSGSAEIAFDATTYSSAAELTVTWRDAWT